MNDPVYHIFTYVYNSRADYERAIRKKVRHTLVAYIHLHEPGYQKNHHLVTYKIVKREYWKLMTEQLRSNSLYG